MMQRPPSKLAGGALLCIGALLMVVGPAFACLSVFPETACLQLAGGSGCDVSLSGHRDVSLSHDAY